MKKVAIFVDWENLRHDIKTLKVSASDFNYSNAKHIMKLLMSFLYKDEELYRIFFYTARPKSWTEIENYFTNLIKKLENNPHKKENIEKIQNYLNFGEEKHKKYASNIENFLKSMEVQPYVAMRYGSLKLKGLKNNGVPDENQKQVDMLIGLDVAQISFSKLADKIMLFSRDSDMKPVLKLARTNGLTAIVPHLNYPDKRLHIDTSLKIHSDLIRKRDFKDIIADLKKTSSVIL